MKKIILSIIILFSFNFEAISHIDHYQNFKYLEYELFRNNKLIGYHKYDFSRENNILTVKSQVNFKITKLGVDLYQYYAESDEIYKDSKFFQFSSKTNQNKKEKYVNIQVDSDKNDLNIDGSSYKGNTPLDSIVGTWWNHEIVKAKRQISAISGRVIDQTVTFIGKEKIIVNNKTYNALHFNFKSSDKSLPDNKKLNTDIWYDEDTLLWIKAAFDKSGYWEYRLKIHK
jgi:hypothetical protein|tara:strand:+ start:124 stop:807 length:684 start_codon:yes stop_codon:yes gene_type:complete